MRISMKAIRKIARMRMACEPTFSVHFVKDSVINVREKNYTTRRVRIEVPGGHAASPGAFGKSSGDSSPAGPWLINSSPVCRNQGKIELGWIKGWSFETAFCWR